MDGAQSWYYRDDSGTEQGPFPAASMRSWLLHQMLPATTAVAPSFYGEVPEQFWPIHELWTPPTDAWAAADAQLAASVVEAPAAASRGDALWQAKVAELAAQHQSEGDGPGPSRSGTSKEPRATPYDRPSGGGLQPLSGKGKGGKGGGKGGGGKGGGGGKDGGGGKGGGKGKGGGRGDPDRALPPHLSRIRAMAAAAESGSGSRFSAAGNAKNSYSYGS